jgi:signal transduction histidine kinase/HAMP domain-containing protein
MPTRSRFKPWKFSRFMSLQTKLIVTFLAVALIPLALLTWINHTTTTTALTQNANHALATAARQTALRLDAFIQNSLDAVRVEAQLPDLVEYLKLPADQQMGSYQEAHVAGVFRSLNRRDPLNALSYALLDRQGVTVFDTNTSNLRRSQAHTDYFQQAIERKFPYASALQVPGLDGLSSLYFSSPVRDSVGNIWGVLAVRYNGAIVQQIIHESVGLAGAESFAVVFDDQHIRIADGSSINQRFKSLMPLPTDAIDSLQRQNRLPRVPAAQLTTNQADLDRALNRVKCETARNCPPVYVTVKVPHQPNRQKQVALVAMTTQPWIVAFGQPKAAFLAPIQAQVRAAMGLGLGIAVMMAMAAIGVARRLAQPMVALAAGVGEFTGGNLEARVKIRAQDEIGMLAASFNDMAEQLGKLLKGLEERTVELEGSQYITFAVSELSKSMLDGDRLLQEAVKLVQSGFAVSYVQIYLWDEATGQLQPRASAEEADASVNALQHPISLSWDWSLVAIAARRFEAQVCHDLSQSPAAQLNYRSQVAVPLVNRGILLGVLDIQDEQPHRFSESDQETFNTLAGQIATALENARLFQAVQAAEMQYRDQAQELQQTIQELQQAQANLVQSEKMSSLGQMVAGVAHEINNPINFIYANLSYLNQYQIDLFKLLQLYQQHYPTPSQDIQREQENIDLNFLTQDFSQILTSMKVGAERIRKIVLSLRNFARLDEAEMKPVDLHEGIESTLVILQSQLKEQDHRPAIEIIREYGKLPLLECYAGQLNQVFMNILVNAIDAIDTKMFTRAKSEGSVKIKTQETLSIKIRTTHEDNYIFVRFSDNGIGMSEQTQGKLFDPFFTTKAVGKGTGLGLSVSYQIVTEQHQGQIYCSSEFGTGSEFVLQLPIVPLRQPKK